MAEQELWVGRDGDGALWQYDGVPHWNKRELYFEMPETAEQIFRLPDEWFSALEVGWKQKVRLAPVWQPVKGDGT